MKTVAAYIDGNLALDISKTNPRMFTVIEGGRFSNQANRIGKSSIKTYVAIGVITFVLASIAFCFTSNWIGSRSAYQDSVSHASITVKAGDSLWSLAAKCDVQGLSTQEVSDMIASWNHLDSATLKPGQKLTVPSN